MTRKKAAIERAITCTCGCLNGRVGPLVAASRAYDAGRIEGRIAGLREAEKIVEPPAFDPDDDCGGYSIASEWLEEAAVQIRERAARLAKKARKHGK